MNIEHIMDSDHFKRTMASYDSGPVPQSVNFPKEHELEITLHDIYASDASPSPDGRKLHPDGSESKPITVKFRAMNGTHDDGIIIDGGRWGVIIENQRGLGTVHVWQEGFNEGLDADFTLLEAPK